MKTHRNNNIYYIALIAVILLFFYSVRSILLPFVLGIILAYILDPLADRLERRFKSRSLSALTITVSFFAIFIAGLAFIIPIFTTQIMEFLPKLPAYIDNIKELSRPYLVKLGITEESSKELLQNNGKELANLGTNFAKKAISSGSSAINFLSLMLITPVVSFYILKDWDIFVSKVKNLIPKDYKKKTTELLNDIDKTLSAFIRGQAQVGIIQAIFYSIALSILGLDFALLIGILAGALTFIPFIGFILSFVPAILVAAFQFGDITSVLFVVGIFTLGQIIEGYFLVPKLVGKEIGLHEVWVMFALLAGGVLYGFTGMLIALPMAAIISVSLSFYYRNYIN